MFAGPRLKNHEIVNSWPDQGSTKWVSWVSDITEDRISEGNFPWKTHIKFLSQSKVPVTENHL